MMAEHHFVFQTRGRILCNKLKPETSYSLDTTKRKKKKFKGKIGSRRKQQRLSYSNRNGILLPSHRNEISVDNKNENIVLIVRASIERDLTREHDT
jgi:hypothetical protein